MKHPASAGMTVVLAVAALGACQGGPSADLESFEGRSSYAVGLDIGMNLERTGVELELAGVLRGISDVLEGRELQMTQEEVGQVLQELSTRMQTAQQERFAEAAERNVTEGQEYLAQNGQRDGVITTESGLQFKVLKAGDGQSPAAEDMVTVHYKGSFIDGKEFDSSFSRGKPATFETDGVIKGWTEALQLMKENAKWQLFVPPDLAYGRTGLEGSIPPNKVLVFEIELISIQKQHNTAQGG